MQPLAQKWSCSRSSSSSSSSAVAQAALTRKLTVANKRTRKRKTQLYATRLLERHGLNTLSVSFIRKRYAWRSCSAGRINAQTFEASQLCASKCYGRGRGRSELRSEKRQPSLGPLLCIIDQATNRFRMNGVHGEKQRASDRLLRMREPQRAESAEVSENTRLASICCC